MAGELRYLPDMPREFRFKDLRMATGNFNPKNRLGHGGSGVVYRGVLPGGDTPVAVKLLDNGNMQGDFLEELTIVSDLRHRHLIRLLGWSQNSGKLLLVYEYMPNGSLDDHLFDPASSKNTLRWEQRYAILRDVASALHYLHYEYYQQVVHRNLMTSNIMLDADFNARLINFGLARAIDDARTWEEFITFDDRMGYIAPECFITSRVTPESDVFGFGVVVLVVVCGCRPASKFTGGIMSLVDWVQELHREERLLDAVDPRLGDGGYVAVDAERLLLLGLACSHPIPGKRPKTDAIVQIISRLLPPPEVPPFTPAFMWPAISGEEDEGSTILETETTHPTLQMFLLRPEASSEEDEVST